MSETKNVRAIDELSSLIQRIQQLTDRKEYGAVGKANDIPLLWRRRVEAISISARDGSWAREAKPEDIEAAKAIRAEMAARYEEQGQLERVNALNAIAAELEQIRVLLPSLAAKACIEAGCEARHITAIAKVRP